MGWKQSLAATIQMNQQEGQDGQCGNFNGDWRDDSKEHLKLRSTTQPLKEEEWLFPRNTRVEEKHAHEVAPSESKVGVEDAKEANMKEAAEQKHLEEEKGEDAKEEPKSTPTSPRKSMMQKMKEKIRGVFRFKADKPCHDTPGWDNRFGFGCSGQSSYEAEGWCAD